MAKQNEEISDVSVSKERIEELKQQAESSPYENIRKKAQNELKRIKEKLLEYTGINILEESLWVVWWNRIEDYILTSLLTWDWLLLIWEPWTNKTWVVQDLAELLDLNFQTYPADKAQFEEIVWFPDLKSSEEMKYLTTPMSIWWKQCILIDEINRALPQHQNKWFEVIRDRSIQGKKIDSLKWVFAAMNPPENVWTNPLDSALASRFSFVVKVPDIFEMKDLEIKRLLEIEGKKDTPAIDFWNPDFKRKVVHLEGKAKKATDLKTFMVNASKRYETLLRGEEKERVKEYVSKFVKTLRNDNRGSVKIEWRRTNMMIRAIIAMKSIREEKVGRELNFEELKHTLEDVVQANSMGIVVWNSDDFKAYMNAHKASLVSILNIDDVKFASQLFKGSLKEKFRTFYNIGLDAKQNRIDEKTIAAAESFITNLIEDLTAFDKRSTREEKNLEFNAIIALHKALEDEWVLISKELKKKMFELFKIASITNKTEESIDYLSDVNKGEKGKKLTAIKRFIEEKTKIHKIPWRALAERVWAYQLEDLDRKLIEKGVYDIKDLVKELEMEYYEQRLILEDLYAFITGKENTGDAVTQLTEEEILELTIEQKTKKKKNLDEDDSDEDEDEEDEDGEEKETDEDE